MKDAILGIFSGMVLGTIMILLVVLVMTFQVRESNGTMKDESATTENFIETGSDTEPELTEIETELEIEPELGTEAETELESKPEVETESDAESEVESESVQESESQAPVEMETEETSEKESKPETSTSSLPYYIKVNRKANCITVYTKDADGNYTVPVRAMICSVGTGSRTPRGTYKISNQYRWHALYMNSYGQYCSRIAEHILFHSVPYTSMSNSALRTTAYNQLGQKASLGCIRLTCIDAKWIYDNCAPGTVVEVYDSTDPGPLGKPTALIIDTSSPYKGWDPTDPAENNPWKTVPITIDGVMNVEVECGSKVDLLSHVTVVDIDGVTPVSVTVQGTVDVNTPGVYKVTYFAVGKIGTIATAQATVTVVATESEITTESESTMTQDVARCQ